MTHSEAIKKSGSLIVSPISGSMHPLIRENVDSGRFVYSAKHPPKVGDVVLYPGGESCGWNTVMHRIVGTNGDSFVIQGDNSRHAEIVPKSDVFGVMTGYFRGQKYRSCRNPVFLIYSFHMVTSRKIASTYRTSQTFFWKAARYVWRRVLHNID